MLSIIILAAGQSKRMHSGLPKVLHKLGGTPILKHVIQTAFKLSPEKIFVVCGHQREKIQELCLQMGVTPVVQEEQLGTAHAVAQVLPYLDPLQKVLILCGDVPLLSFELIEKLMVQSREKALGFVTAKMSDPTGFGRVIRNSSGRVIDIVEEADADDVLRRIHEINAGIYATSSEILDRFLPKISNQNRQNEYYLTDLIRYLAKTSEEITTVEAFSEKEIMGINDRKQLASLERYYQEMKVDQLMKNGAGFADPKRFDVRGECTLGRDVFFDIDVVLEGTVRIGNNVTIGPYTYLRDVTIKEGVTILSHSVVEDACIEEGCTVGPFARIRPGTHLKKGAKVGNFVEIKKSEVGEYSKINHLSYIGDSEIGKHVNIGAGTITCNYDGVNKHKTVIEDDVFIGSDCQLVAPVVIGQGAMIGAGSTITENTPSHQLTLSRTKQFTLPNWKKPEKSKE